MTRSKQKMDWAVRAFLVSLAGAFAVVGGGFAVTLEISPPIWIALSAIGAAVSGVIGWLLVRSAGKYSC